MSAPELERKYTLVDGRGTTHEVTAFNAMWAVSAVLKNLRRDGLAYWAPPSPCTVTVKETGEKIKVEWDEKGWRCKWTLEQGMR